MYCAAAAAAAAKLLQSCPTLCEPQMAATRLLHPWDSPGKKMSGLPFPSPMHESEKWKWSCSVLSDSQRPHRLQPTRLLRPWDFPGKNTGVGCHFLLQGIFLTQGSNPGLPHCRQTLYPLSHLDSILKSKDVTLPKKVHLVKAMVFPVVMYGCESWTIKKAEHQRIDAFVLWCWRRLLRVPWTARRSNQSILKEISPEIYWKDWCWS